MKPSSTESTLKHFNEVCINVSTFMVEYAGVSPWWPSCVFLKTLQLSTLFTAIRAEAKIINGNIKSLTLKKTSA